MKRFLPAIALFIFACQSHHLETVDNLNDPATLTSDRYHEQVKAAALPADCFDKSKVEKEVVCAEVFDPVCGCDGVTYSNPCKAAASGILKTTKGECPAN